MALSLKEIQAKLQAQQDKKDRAKNGVFGGDSAIYPFWNNPEGSTVALRLLPDGDESNDFFWVERLIIKLSFPGIKGQVDSKPVEIQVPCMDMWKPNSCPILAETRAWWKDPSLEELARKYWKKKNYLFQGFVVGQNPNQQDKTPENPIRRLVINPTIYDIIKAILMRQDLENTPTDYVHGRDFYLTKTSKGGFANYQSSSWSMKERALTEEENAAIEKNGLFNLSQFLPKKPDETALKVIMEMFHASVDEEMYDAERWGEYFKPSNFKNENTDGASENTSTNAPKAPVTAATIMNRVVKATKAELKEEAKVEPADKSDDSLPFVPNSTVEPTDGKQKMNTPEDILAAIRRRQGSK